MVGQEPRLKYTRWVKLIFSPGTNFQNIKGDFQYKLRRFVKCFFPI